LFQIGKENTQPHFEILVKEIPQQKRKTPRK